MKITYLATQHDKDNRNITGMLGAQANLIKALTNEGAAIEQISTVKKHIAYTRAKWSFYHNLLKQDYYRWADQVVVKDCSTQVSQQLSSLDSIDNKPDIVLFSENIPQVAYLECSQPVVLWTDSTLAGLIDFYPYLSNLCGETKSNIYKFERMALKRCDLIIFTSHWAKDIASKIYGLKENKLKVVGWGANIECNRELSDIKALIEKRKEDKICKLLFVGVDWDRKGGNVGVMMAQFLNSVGFKTQLTVVGCTPVIPSEDISFIKVIDFIDKSTAEGKAKFNELMSYSHFLILPTKADCSPHILAEANSFGVPCLTTKVGGIPTIIKEKINGRKFNMQDDGLVACLYYIISLLRNWDEYEKLALSSYNEYKSNLSWEVVGKEAFSLLKELI